MLALGGNKLGNDGAMHLAKCITNVEALYLPGCNIGAIGVESLSQGIMQRDHPVITTLIYCFVNIFIWLCYET